MEKRSKAANRRGVDVDRQSTHSPIVSVVFARPFSGRGLGFRTVRMEREGVRRLVGSSRVRAQGDNGVFARRLGTARS